jgi:hypothetical protein
VAVGRGEIVVVVLDGLGVGITWHELLSLA